MSTEQEAVERLRSAVRHISAAIQAAIEAGFGSQVTVPLDDALKHALYALDTAEGRT